MGLENLVVVQGDPFPERELATVAPVHDYTPTGLIAAVKRMNEGTDFRGSRLRAPTDFGVGATFDLSRSLDEETGLAVRKVRTGADFLLSQPIFDPGEAVRFKETFLARHGGGDLPVPVFFGLQMLQLDGVLFNTVPAAVLEELEAGRPGVEIAVELYSRFREAGLHNVYLIPPIRRGGGRDYAAARDFLEAAPRS